jgi:hypothetical protein
VNARVITGTFHLVRRGRGLEMQKAPAKPKAPPTRPLRVARMLALAHKIEAMTDQGRTAVSIAYALGFTRARISQLTSLTLLAPDIQEQLLFWTTEAGDDPVCEHALREVVRFPDWPSQRAVFAHLLLTHNP